MRIIFVTVRPPYPLTAGGRIRTFHLLRHISQVHSVTLTTAIETDEDASAARALQAQIPQLTLRLTTVPPRRSGLRGLMTALFSPVDPLPYTWAAYRHPRFTGNLKRALQADSFDLLHCDNTNIAHAVLSLETPPRLLNAHNVDSLLLRRLAQIERRPWKRALFAWQAKKVSLAERRTYPAFRGCLAMSDVDKAHIEKIAPGLRIWTVPNGVDIDWFAPPEVPAEPYLMAFVGAMDWLPNIDAVRFFAGDILPGIRRLLPGARLLVVGRRPSPALVRGLATHGVDFTGTVDDVRPYMARSSLIVVPLRVGSGTRLKILEAWAMGRPVLSTSLGAEGLPVRSGENIAIADTPDALIERVVALLRNPAAAQRLGTAGRHTVEATFSWKRIGDNLLDAYEAALA